MSASWVVDSSVALAWIHPAQRTGATDRLLGDIESGANIVVPVIWFSEIANTLLVLQRRKKLTAAERKLALETLGKLAYTIDEECVRPVFGKTSELAEQYELTIYDAIYLELALRRNLPLASRDEALNKAAHKAGIKTL